MCLGEHRECFKNNNCIVYRILSKYLGHLGGCQRIPERGSEYGIHGEVAEPVLGRSCKLDFYL